MDRRIESDVIIVGGRPAGASLALRLGARGRRVLLLEKATFPSAPAVPSCPILYSPAMRLLDELGVAESDYADDSAKITGFGIEAEGCFSTTMDVPMALGRDYGMGLDRAQFDSMLWNRIADCATVDRRDSCSFRDVIRDSHGVVIGVTAVDASGALEIRAPLTVGADGRFSAVARAVGAAVLDDYSEQTSTVHFADWEELAPFAPDREHMASLCVSGRGVTVLFFPAPRGRTMVATHIRSDRVEVGGDVERFYEAVLGQYAGVRRRLEGARRVSKVLGIKRVANRMLEPCGRGWALVGDALHHKDPIDGQGIYDALLEAKLLDEHLDALDGYREAVLAATRPMMHATVRRLRRELYEDAPPWAMRTVMRWMMTDLEYQRRFLSFLQRQEPPETWPPASLVRDAVLRGIARDARRLFTRSA